MTEIDVGIDGNFCVPGKRRSDELMTEPNCPGQIFINRFEGVLGERGELGNLQRKIVVALFNYYDARYQVGLTREALMLPGQDETTTNDLKTKLKRQKIKCDRYKSLLTLPDIFVAQEDRDFFSEMRTTLVESDPTPEDAEAIINIRDYFRVRSMQVEMSEGQPDTAGAPIHCFIDLNAHLDRTVESDDQSNIIYNRAMKAILDFYRARGRLEEEVLVNGEQPVSDHDLIRCLCTVFGREVTAEDMAKLKIPEYKLMKVSDPQDVDSRERRFDYTSAILCGEGLQDPNPLYGIILRNFREVRDQLEQNLRDKIETFTEVPEEVHDFATTVALIRAFKGMFSAEKEVKTPKPPTPEDYLDILGQVPPQKWEDFIRKHLPPDQAEIALRILSKRIMKDLRSSRPQKK